VLPVLPVLLLWCCVLPVLLLWCCDRRCICQHNS
jgi:hypothetical protein